MLILLAWGVLALLILVITGIGSMLWWSLPPARMELRIAGLSAPANIDFDTHAIPRIQAQNAVDAMAALGFLHARDRMFQLDLMRRAASGRLSEIFGGETLSLDRQMRTLGLAQAAQTDFSALSLETRILMDAYARGVNSWIDLRGRVAAPEFIWLGAPEHWQPWHSLLWGKTMGMWLSENWRTELSRLALDGMLPRERIDELWPPATPDHRPDRTTYGAVTPEQSAVARALLAALPMIPGHAPTASNEWAVDARHSQTGAPLLAGDPHLAYSAPGIWYLARIETPAQVLVGATAPGVPAMVIGHNGVIAWTFTTTAADVQDVFIETEIDANTYQTPDGPRPYLVREEVIRVRGQADEILRVRTTRHGPVISDIMARDGTRQGPVLAVAMANLLPGDRSADGLLALNAAQTVEEAGAAAPLISATVQNLLVADRAHIGLFVTGRVPVRRAGDGSRPVAGADGRHDWIGWASGSELPHYIDPPSGRLVNANERIAPENYPVFLGRDWFGDWRARRIHTLLNARNTHGLDDFVRMQVDTTSNFAQQLLPVLRTMPAPRGLAGVAFTLLANWDGAMAMDRPQPLIFNAWMRRFRRLVLEAAKIPTNVVSPASEFLAFVLSPAGAHWLNNDRDGLLAHALEQAVAELAVQYGTDPASWRWGTAHPSVFAHPFLRHIPGLAWLSTVRIASPGDASTINRATPAGDSFEAVHGAGYRGVYDLANLERSRFMIAPGQSGHWLRHHAGDLAPLWRDGQMLELGARAAGTPATLRLTP
ncbi:MAG: penicillin acylase family protein [Acetobacteraceae bacterium]|nr:penicillin acylase family protein [Acetobacteraceae bacterium]